MTDKRILCFGDSNTYGYDPRDPFGGRYPKEVRWTGRLEHAGLMVFNRGMNGATVPSPGQYGAFVELIGSLLPLSAVTVMFGTNDILQGHSAEETGARMAAFLDAIAAKTGGAKSVLLAPPPLVIGDWVQSEAIIAESEKLAAFYQAIAEERHIAFADAGQWEIGLTFDGVHFTDAGHAAFADGLLSLLI